jgi:hypothetical protein
LEFLAEPGLNVNDAAHHIRRCRIWTDSDDLPIALAGRGAQQYLGAAFGFKGQPHFFQQLVAPHNKRAATRPSTEKISTRNELRAAALPVSPSLDGDE